MKLWVLALLVGGAPAQAQKHLVPLSIPPHWAGHIVFQSLDCKTPHKSFGRIVDYIATSPDGGQEAVPNAPVDKHVQACLPPPDDAQAYRALQVRKFSEARALLLRTASHSNQTICSIPTGHPSSSPRLRPCPRCTKRFAPLI